MKTLTLNQNNMELCNDQKKCSTDRVSWHLLNQLHEGASLRRFKVKKKKNNDLYMEVI